jgi:hypothetical protein
VLTAKFTGSEGVDIARAFAESATDLRQKLSPGAREEFSELCRAGCLSQPSVRGKKALPGPQGRLPGLVIRFVCPIGGTATMACDLPMVLHRPVETTAFIRTLAQDDHRRRNVSSVSHSAKAVEKTFPTVILYHCYSKLPIHRLFRLGHLSTPVRY